MAMRSETTLKVRLEPVPAGEQNIRMAHNLPADLIITQCRMRLKRSRNPTPPPGDFKAL
jgi:hypothetical protein